MWKLFVMSAVESPESKRSHWITLLGLLFFLAAAAVVSFRAESNHSVPGTHTDESSIENEGYRDFQNAIYFPVRAVVSGINPYSSEYQTEYHPDGRGFPPFAPSSLLLHSPLAFLNLHTAERVYLLFNFTLLILVCWMSLRQCKLPYALAAALLLSGVVLLSRPGLMNFMGLQMTLLLVLGCLLALEFAHDHPGVSGFGLLLACCKPHFVIPLALIMLCRRNFSAVSLGITFCVIANVATISFIANQNGGAKEFFDQANEQYAGFLESPSEVPHVRVSWTQLDLHSVIARWIDVPETVVLNASEESSDDTTQQEWSLSVLVAAGVLLFAALMTLLERDPQQRIGINSRTGVFALLVMLVWIYHQPYDALVLWIPMIALLASDERIHAAMGGFSRGVLLLLMSVPMFNYATTNLVLGKLEFDNGVDTKPEGLDLLGELAHAWPWKAIVTANGIALAIAVLFVALLILIGTRASQASDD